MARYIDVEDLDRKYILQEDIECKYGKILKKGSILISSYKDTLKKFEVMKLYVEECTGSVVDMQALSDLNKSIDRQVEEVSTRVCAKLEEYKEVNRYIKNRVRESGLEETLNELLRNDRYTYKHSINVAILTALLCMRNGIDGEEKRDTVIGALIHDVGKLLIPKEILNKCGRLDDVEMEIMRSHASIGLEIVSRDNRFSELVRDVVGSHHERDNGAGYPKKTKGNISLGAKVVSVADVFDALVSDRPYRSGMSINKAIEILSKDSLNSDIKDSLFHMVVYYPINSVVIISNGCIGVVEENGEDLQRPCIRLIYDMVVSERIDEKVELINSDAYIVDRIDNKQNIDRITPI